MNEWKDLETHLRSWKPRRPSARLERRLFARPRRLVVELPASRPAFGWFAPASAALLLLGLVLNHHASAGFVSNASEPMVALALSNQSAAAWLPGSFSCEKNALRPETFDWTNASRSTSSITSRAGTRGNF